MTTTTWTALQAEDTLLSTEMNSLANNAVSSAGSALASNTYPLCVVEFVVTFGVAPSAGGVVDFFITPSTDGGTDYGDANVSVAEPWITLGVAAVTSAQRVTRKGIELPPGHFKIFARNRAGQTMAASGNTLKIARHGLSTS